MKEDKQAPEPEAALKSVNVRLDIRFRRRVTPLTLLFPLHTQQELFHTLLFLCCFPSSC